jgi:hypothetical protein
MVFRAVQVYTVNVSNLGYVETGMARKKANYGTDLFHQTTDAIPVGLRERCCGCGQDVDMRRIGWVVLGDGGVSHGGEDCWRQAMKAEMAKLALRVIPAKLGDRI